MKKTILFFTLITSSIFFAQIQQIDTPKCVEVGVIKDFSVPYWVKSEKCGKDLYVFSYKDIKYTSIDNFKNFQFRDEQNAFDFLYNKIMEGFSNPPKEPVMLNLPNDILYIEYVKALGVVNVRISQSVSKSNIFGFSRWLTKKQVMKLFGKEKKVEDEE